MRKAGAFLLLLLVGLSPLFAQDDDPSIEDDWDDYTFGLYAPGDQTITISLGTVFPTVFFNNGKLIEHNFSPPVGGTGSIGYNYFLSSNFFVGGDIGMMFLITLNGNYFFSPQFGVNAGYQFNIWKLEFPISAGLGMTWHNYLNHSYYGLYLKGSAAAFFRATSDWSFGLTVSWGWLPEWTNDISKNVDGNILYTVLSARYHF